MEYSFPVLERPLTDQQWGQVTLGLGSGILTNSTTQYSRGTISNVGNTVQVLSGADYAQAVVSGFYHRIDSPVTLSVPAVTKATTYYVGLTYDPLAHSAATGPVSLGATTSKPSGSGKVYLPLFEIRRNPNELLTDATFTDLRQYISPRISVQRASALPTEGVLLTTVATALDTGTDYRLDQSGTWRTQSPYYVKGISPSNWITTANSDNLWLVTPTADGRRHVSGSVTLTRAADSLTIGTGWASRGTIIPTELRRGSGTVYRFFSGVLAGRACNIRLNLVDGDLSVALATGSVTVDNGDAILFSASWTI